MSLTVFTNAFLLDCTGADPVEGAAVVVEDDRIKAVVPGGAVGPLPGRVTTLDCKGATLMPGLTDAHVHICAVEGNITDQHRYLPPSLLAAKALRRAEECLLQGFTTVRDAGGADAGLRQAINDGLSPGPRRLGAGNYVSQAGGHGDKRRRAEWIEPSRCCIGMLGWIADGGAEVRRGVRGQLRRDGCDLTVIAGRVSAPGVVVGVDRGGELAQRVDGQIGEDVAGRAGPQRVGPLDPADHDDVPG